MIYNAGYSICVVLRNPYMLYIINTANSHNVYLEFPILFIFFLENITDIKVIPNSPNIIRL